MTQGSSFVIGIDGGGTRCRARLVDNRGETLAEAVSGSANIFQDAQNAWHSVQSVLSELCHLAQLPLSEIQSAPIVAGLAGAEVSSCVSQFQFLATSLPRLTVMTDAQVACIGAHQGQPGAAYIVGTGSIGVSWQGGQWRRVGGWGFPLADQGSGAWLGQQAIRLALDAKDGLVPATQLTEQVWAVFQDQPERLLRWSQEATSGQFGEFSPYVTAAYARGDSHAITIVAQQIEFLTKQINALVTNDLKLSLMGGLSHWVEPLLPKSIQEKLTPAQGDALSGAVRCAQQGISS